MNVNVFINKTDFSNPNDFGFVDVSVMENCKDFVLMVSNPFTRLDAWLNTSVICTRNITIIAPKNAPCSGELSEVAKFCKKYHVEFMDSPLSNTANFNYIKMFGCTFVNISNVITQPKLLLVYIPDYMKRVDIPDNDSIIGVSTNTVNLSSIEHLSIPGKLYGNFIKDFSKCCTEKYGRIIYDNKSVIHSFSKFFENNLHHTKETVRA